MEKRRLGPCITFFPQPTTLIGSVDRHGRANLMTASWVSIVSKTPPTLAVSLHHARLSYRNLQESGCFSVNLVPADLVVAADYCGLRSGRDDDKPRTAGLTLTAASQIDAPLVDESPLSVECRVSSEVEIGEYRLVLGEILEIHATAAALRADGSLDAAAFDPLVYLGGIREYWDLGERRGVAYRDGKALFPQP